MKLRKTAGLVGAGGVSQSFVARMPAFLEQLGPVKGSSLKVSRRIANGLRAGVGVDDYSALASCGLIWIYAPENLLDALAAELAASQSAGRQDGGAVRCAARQPLAQSFANGRRARGDVELFAGIATSGSSWPKDIRRRWRNCENCWRGIAASLIEIRPATKPLYLAGVHLASHLLLPWVAGAAESLRAAGFPRNEAVSAVEALGERTLRAYGKAGDKAWNRAAAEQLQRAVAEDFETLQQTDIRLAALFSDGGERMLRYFAKPVQKQRLKVMARRSG